MVATVVLAGALVAASIVVVMLLRAGLVRSVAPEAKVRAAELAALGAAGPLPVPLPALVAPWPTLVQVVDGDGRVVTASAELTGRPPLLPVGPGNREQVETLHAALGRGGHEWRVESVPATIAAQGVTVVVATAIDQFDRDARLLATLLVIGVPILTALVALLTWRVVGRALRPVEAMRREVADVAADAAGRRVDHPPGDDEISRLGRTLNAMLARLDASMARQDQFVADASHELRSPLANIQVALEVAKAHPEMADWPAVADDVLAQDARMQVLVDDLLVLARSRSGPDRAWTARVDLSEVVGEVVAAEVPPPAVRVDALQPAVVVGGRDELRRVATNLIANARRFATHRVTVSVTNAGRWAELVVADDGPGIPVADRGRVFDRFVRLDQDRARTGGGAGLGLAIVKELVERHGGSVIIADAQPGAIVVVRLPLDAG